MFFESQEDPTAWYYADLRRDEARRRREDAFAAEVVLREREKAAVLGVAAFVAWVLAEGSAA